MLNIAVDHRIEHKIAFDANTYQNVISTKLNLIQIVFNLEYRSINLLLCCVFFKNPNKVLQSI